MPSLRPGPRSVLSLLQSPVTSVRLPAMEGFGISGRDRTRQTNDAGGASVAEGLLLFVSLADLPI